jgi:hypothetical protein
MFSANSMELIRLSPVEKVFVVGSEALVERGRLL